MAERTIKVDRPVSATLVVRTEHGDTWDATDDDFQRFGLIDRNAAEYAVTVAMTAMGLDPDNKHSALRYAIQRAVGGTPLGAYEDDHDTIEELAVWAPTVPPCDPEDA